MAPQKAEGASTALSVSHPFEHEQLPGRLNISNTPDAEALQVAFVVRRHAVRRPLATTIAQLAFGEARP